MMSLALTPGRSVPSTLMAMVLNGFRDSVWVAMTCSTSEVPMPMASAPKAPWVEVCESPQTTVMPGCVRPSCGPTTCTIPCSASPSECRRTPNSWQLLRRVWIWVRLVRSAIGLSMSSVGVLWSSVAMVRSGRRSLRPARRKTFKCLRGRHLVHQVEVDEKEVRLGVGSFAVPLAHHVRVPDFLGQCLCHGLLPSLR